MTIKVLFFDTCALLKMFVNEDGTQNVKWLTDPRRKVSWSLHFVINEQVCSEFEDKIKTFANKGKISRERADNILYMFATHYKGVLFQVVGTNIISNSQQEKNIDDLIHQLNLNKGKNDWDAIIYKSIVNALAYLGGDSHPILVTCDMNFGKKVAKQGYRVINPEKQNLNDIANTVLSSVSSAVPS